MIEIKYFAGTREALGSDGESFEMPSPVADVAQVLAWLRERGEPWSSVLDGDRLLYAVNHEMVSISSRVEEGDEVAFFPPVTGG